MSTSETSRARQHHKNVKKWPRKAGKADYFRFLRGERLTRSESIRAKCYDCACGEDIRPCSVEICPLLPYCPYGAVKLPKPS